MSRFLRFMAVSLFLLSLPAATLFPDDGTSRRQKDILKKLDDLRYQQGFSITARAKLDWQVAFGSGRAFSTNGPVMDDLPVIQVDLGFDVHPFPGFRALGVLRLQNNIRGFYGSGDVIDARDIFLEVKPFKFLTATAGDFRKAYSPLTLWTVKDDMAYSAAIYQMSRDDEYYQSRFDDGNAWPLEGLSLDARFNPDAGRLGFNAFTARVDSVSSGAAFDRHLSGGRISFDGSGVDCAASGLLYSDLVGTKPPALNAVPLSLADLSASVVLDVGKYFGSGFPLDRFDLEGEGCLSMTRTNTNVPAVNGSGLTADCVLGIKKNFLKIGYRWIGAEYLAPGAQTWTWNSGAAPFLASAGIEDDLFFRVPNDRIQVIRRWNRYLRLSLPGGAATPDRTGVSAEFRSLYFDVFRIRLAVDSLAEVRPVGAATRRSFKVFEAGFRAAPIKGLILTATGRYEKILRKDDPLTAGIGQDEAEDMTTAILEAGVDIAIVRRLSLLAGAVLIDQKGFLRFDVDAANTPLAVTGYQSYSADLRSLVLSAGLKYSFNAKTFAQLSVDSLGHTDRADRSKDYALLISRLSFVMEF